MSDARSPELNADLEGPLDVAQFPDTLSTHVVTPGPRPRLHGYDVEGDLARHYGSTDLLVLSLTGELPPPEGARALGIALAFLAPLATTHASVHAASLARLCGTASVSTIGVAAIALAEQAKVLLDEHADLLAWLRLQNAPFPERHRTSDVAEQASVARLREALAETGFSAPELEASPTRDAALLSVLFRCGLEERAQIESALVTARLPSTMAEAMAVKVTDFDHYPINLPRYLYRDVR